MKTVTLSTIAAGPGGVMLPGKHNVSDNHAAELEAGGFAVVHPDRTTAVAPAETAVVTAPEKRGRRK